MIHSPSDIAGRDVAEHYDELDHFYREVWGEHVHHGLWISGPEPREQALRQLVEKVAREARVEQGSRVCDIGCGYGATARQLAQEHGARVTAITISPAQHAFAQAREGAAQNVAYVLGDWLQSGLPDAAFDSAIAIESSEHMPDKARFFAQAHRVLRPGGRLVVCAWLAREHPTRLQRQSLLEPICRDGRMPHLGTESDYRQLAESAGFCVECFDDITHGVARTWPGIAVVFLRKLARAPRFLRFVLGRHARNRVFALTAFRIWLAYRTGAMRYGVFTFRRSEEAPLSFSSSSFSQTREEEDEDKEKDEEVRREYRLCFPPAFL